MGPPGVFNPHILAEEWMLEALLGGWTLLGVPLEHLEDEVDGVTRGLGYDALQGCDRAAGEINPSRRGQLVAFLPINRWRTQDQAEFHKLVSL